MRADAGLVRRLEAHAVEAWPATVNERVDGGWVLRATPGLDRGRSNHALPPCRPLWAGEIPEAIARVEVFAREHGIHGGIQVSPLSLHGTLQAELDRRGWETRWPVLVLAASRASSAAWSGPELEGSLERADHATPEWLAAWDHCEPNRDVEAHASTVFRRLAGRATFARVDGDAAVGIAWRAMASSACSAWPWIRRGGARGSGPRSCARCWRGRGQASPTCRSRSETRRRWGCTGGSGSPRRTATATGWRRLLGKKP